ncbi:MAG: hypothetical protein ABSH44_03150 [Bryobacteraceae bacterium]|jgi:hypothetical protein
MPETTHTSDSAVAQEVILKEMQDFSASNPQIMEALEAMNQSLADYLQALETIRGGQTVSCSPSAHLPLHVSF